MEQQSEEIIQELIRQGHKKINRPISLITIAITLPLLILTGLKFITFYSLLIGMGFTLIITWLFWSFKITKWRIFAYDQLEESDLDEFHYKAVKAKLLWPQGSVFEKTEIRNHSEKVRIDSILKKQ